MCDEHATRVELLATYRSRDGGGRAQEERDLEELVSRYNRGEFDAQAYAAMKKSITGIRSAARNSVAAPLLAAAELIEARAARVSWPDVAMPGRAVLTPDATCRACGGPHDVSRCERESAAGLASDTSATHRRVGLRSALRPASPPRVAGGRKFVGQAPLTASGLTVSRLLDAAAYGVFGIMMFVITSAAHGAAIVGLVALGAVSLAYAFKILLTRTSYWVSSAVYAIALIGVVVACTALLHRH